MKLSLAHRLDLWSIAKRGLATLASVFLFFGTTATGDVSELSLYSGILASVVIFGCISSSYRNLLPVGISLEQRRLGFVLFWLSGSVGFNLLWRLPYWLFICQASRTADGFWWKIVWWSYTLHDSWYASTSDFVLAFEGWRILCNVVGGGLGLAKYYQYSSVPLTVDSQEIYIQACLCFMVTATFQIGNTAIYAFLTVSRRQNVEGSFLGHIVLWSFNGFTQLSSSKTSSVDATDTLSPKSLAEASDCSSCIT